MSHRYRAAFFSLSILLLSGLLVGFQPAPVSAQLKVESDIQLDKGDGKLSTTKSVFGSAGKTVVIEIFATGYTNAQGVEVFLDVPDIKAIDGQAVGASTEFPVVINSVLGNQLRVRKSTPDVRRDFWCTQKLFRRTETGCFHDLKTVQHL